MSDTQTDADGDGHRYDPSADHSFPDERLNDVLEYLESDEGDTGLSRGPERQSSRPKGVQRPREQTRQHRPTSGALPLRPPQAGRGHVQRRARTGLDEADEPVIVALAATLHDIGHVVHRDEHPYYSIPLAADLLGRVLPEFYDVADAVRVKGEVLHAILCHHTPEDPLTLEAGVVRVADALDMEQGRSRIPYEQGGRGINTVSSQAIKRVFLEPGDDKAVLVEIGMTNAAGVYQVDNLQKAKLQGSGLEEHVRIVALNIREETEPLVERIEL